MRIDGRGTYTYLVTLNGFSPQIPSWVGLNRRQEEDWKKTRIVRYYRHAPLEYRGRPIEALKYDENYAVGSRGENPRVCQRHS